jgi:amino acid transporter
LLLQTLHDILIGPPLPTQRALQERLNKVRALAALSPDALSSIAYANQEIFLGLVVAGAAGLVYSRTIALVIVALLGILTLSYSQIILAYPMGGGAYTVAHENLGTLPGLVAAAALMIDYVLTAAVSLTAGVAAMASAFPALWPHRTLLALALLALIMLANLRGLREAGTLMAVPVYLFLFTYLAMIAYGAARAVIEGPGSYATTAASLPGEPLTLFLVLHAFSSGCTALTGIEAISNGVQIFKPPESRNANQTMAVIAILMAVLFLGTTSLTQHFAIVAGPEETILSALARHIFGSGPLYLIVQASTLLVLTVAANTSFVGFPRVAYLMARDRFAPRQLLMLGDRLVLSNGILALSGLAAVLIVVFGGDTHALIPLFAVGVFLAFTLSQAGMVVHWAHERGRGWHVKAAINGLGAAATSVTLIVVGASKFAGGAWIVMLAIPLLVLAFRAVHAHYQETRRELTLKGLPPSLDVPPSPRIVLPISGVHRGVIDALRYALSISDRVTAVYVEVEPGTADEIRERWKRWGLGVPLEIVPSPYRSVIGPFLEFLDRTDEEHNDGQLATVLMTEIVPAKWWQFLLHNQTAWILKLALLYRRRRFGKKRAITDVPTHLKR